MFADFSSVQGRVDTTEYIKGRDEIGGVYLSAFSAGTYTATLYMMVNRVKGGGRAPHPHQPRLIFPSWWDVRQKSAIATLCVLCGGHWRKSYYIAGLPLLLKNLRMGWGRGWEGLRDAKKCKSQISKRKGRVCNCVCVRVERVSFVYTGF